MHVEAWWADDLDGDGVLEDIAAVCNQHQGFYLVQHGDKLLEAGLEIDGRNNCEDGPPAPWQVRHDGRIVETVEIHKATERYDLAIRAHQLVMLRQTERSWEAAHSEHDAVVMDYEHLTWSDDEQSDSGNRSERGVLVLAAPSVHRSTRLAGATVLTATTSGEYDVTLHLHADRTVEACTTDDSFCHAQHVEPGDVDLATFATALALSQDVGFVVGGTRDRRARHQLPDRR